MMPFPINLLVETGLAPSHAAETRQAASLQSLRHLLHLPKLQLHRSRAPEDRDHDFQSLAILGNLIHNARKRSEQPFADTYRLVVLEPDLKPRLLAAVNDPINTI